jgi:serine/threonine protein kinase
MELDILHRAISPEIVEFYGAFFIESCVYYCMEYMDAGSLDKLMGAGVPEDVLAQIAGAMVRGLGFLKDELQIIHRGASAWLVTTYLGLTSSRADVKPTNVLVNKKGEVKLCDFGVSGQLEKSLAKTNIGCQSYMAVRTNAFTPLQLYLTSLLAGAHQRRVAEQPRDLHRLLRCLVSRSIDDRDRLGQIPIPTRNLLECVRTTDRYCAW